MSRMQTGSVIVFTMFFLWGNRLAVNDDPKWCYFVIDQQLLVSTPL